VTAPPQGQLAQPGSARQPLAGGVSPRADPARATNARSDFNIGFWDSLRLSDSPLQLTLQAIGLVPVIGEPTDAIDGIVYALEGDAASASASFAAMIPVAGTGATAAHWWKRAADAADAVNDARKAERTSPAIDAAEKVYDKLPRVEDLRRYDPDELRQLSRDLQESFHAWIRKMTELGRDSGHGARQAAEQQLINAIERRLQQFGN
jgi:hypothetical protein